MKANNHKDYKIYLKVHFICFWPDNKTFQAPLAFLKLIFFGFEGRSVHVLHACVYTEGVLLKRTFTPL